VEAGGKQSNRLANFSEYIENRRETEGRKSANSVEISLCSEINRENAGCFGFLRFIIMLTRTHHCFLP
jgi:hypothetical protein